LRQRRDPAVSVVIATYNWSSVLRHAVASVLAQTFTDFELLVVGDACTDDSAAVVRSYRDRRVQWHNLERNAGSQVGPNNRGLALARGRYVAYLGHDDLWLPDHLRLLVECIERTAADLVFSLGLILGPEGEAALSGVLFVPFGPGDFVPPSTLMHRRTVVERIGPWPDEKSVERPVDDAWLQSARAAGLRFAANERLTVIKFPSSQRRDSYLRRSDDEQRHWRSRIEREPDLEAVELARLLGVALAGDLARLRRGIETYEPPGWRMAYHRRVRGLASGVREMTALPAELDARNLRLTVPAPPTAARAGEPFRFDVDFENRSDHLVATADPHPVHLSYRWRGPDGRVLGGDARRSVLAHPLPAGATARYCVEVMAPSQAGRFVLEPLVVQELVRWFDEPPEAVLRFEVEVTAAEGTQPAVSPS
jgi:glycosyltransferase involved in cell wall biosynthesis